MWKVALSRNNIIKRIGAMNKSGKEKRMASHFCTDVKTESGKMQLKESVERIIKQNKKVFDKLAKS